MFKVGMGYDVHRLAEGETLILGGVQFDSSFGTIAHSDGDVLLHAICDAFLGAAALGDIGEHFPDTSPEFKGISSLELLRRTIQLIENQGYKAINLDATLVLEAPKVNPHKQAMRANIASQCGLDISCVNIKATTSEKLGFVGAGEGVQAYCVCMIQKINC